ncbi:MAG: type II toxin-antitoxin system RelE/ParE family toxin [Balneolaceae bacterium]|nr:type II toxin-antitoxin system RelE/ParE family toxin [Balneolaceae bacterium]
MEVIWTRQAILMVNEFVDYIAQDDYETAEQWALELMSQTDKLADHPKIGRVVPEYNEETLREFIVGNYRLPYRIREDRIYIEAVWLVRQNPPAKE